MQESEILKLIAARIYGDESREEKIKLDYWLLQNKENEKLFLETKALWKDKGQKVLTLKERLNRRYITNGLIQETIGSLAGFVIGLSITNTFTHYVTEKRSYRNLYGILGRKKKVVNDIPEWTQFCLSVLLGFIALELINYFFQSKSYLKIWNFLKSLTGF